MAVVIDVTLRGTYGREDVESYISSIGLARSAERMGSRLSVASGALPQYLRVFVPDECLAPSVGSPSFLVQMLGACSELKELNGVAHAVPAFDTMAALRRRSKRRASAPAIA